MPNNVLITGATGFIGSYILRQWLKETDSHFHLLVRYMDEKSGKQRIKSILDRFSMNNSESWMDRISLYHADVALPEFGLSSDKYKQLARITNKIIHCAAAVRFDLTLDEARRINVGGVKNIVRFARACKKLIRLDYIGTAYVSGWRTGLIKEIELDMGQDHRNSYERSKFEAEVYLQKQMTDIPITVYRPSIVVCDSEIGVSSPFNSFYRVMWMYLRGGVSKFAGCPDSKLDLVPVDYISKALFTISTKSDSLGECYHLAAGPKGSTTIGEIRDHVSQLSRKEAFELMPPKQFKSFFDQRIDNLSDEESKVLKELALYLPYTDCKQEYDNQLCVQACGFEPPGIFTYIHRFVRNILT